VTEPDPPKDFDDEDEDEDAPKKKKKPVKQPSPFKVLVLFSLLQDKSEAEMTAEDRATRERIRRLYAEILQSSTQGRPTRKQMDRLNKLLAAEVDRVSNAQLERFLKRQLASSGTMEVTEVKLDSQKEKEYHFRVRSKARPDTVRTWPHEMKLFFGLVKIPVKVGVGTVVYVIEDYIVAGIGAMIAMLLGTVITAFFIPNMMRKGTIDLLISKPIHRWALLLYKYIGGMSFMFIPTAVVVVGIWLALGLRSGLWGTNFLLTIPVLVLQFAIFYAVSTLVAVLTRSPILCILACCLVYAALWFIPKLEGWVKPFHEMDITPAWVYNSLDTTRKVLPRYKDLDLLNSQLIAADLLPKDEAVRRTIDKSVEEIDWGQSLAVTFGYIGIMIALACWRFSVKDY
jgi:ABC-type transport system involved in multi-copper enzyme maturation permease subunit